jgi:hypothetical protein
MMATGPMPLLLIGGIALLSLFLGLWQQRTSRKLGSELYQLQQQLSELKSGQEQKPTFSNSLERVEREQLKVDVPRSSSEKYRYVASLADQGVDAKGIAAALQMAQGEVEQLLQLTKLKRKSSESLATDSTSVVRTPGQVKDLRMAGRQAVIAEKEEQPDV